MQQKHKSKGKTRPRMPVIALLLSMAALAECAATLHGPIRRVMLYFLQRGEKAAYSIVYWALHERGVPLQWAAPDHVRTGTDADAALSLGEWFRILALALRDLPRRLRFCTGPLRKTGGKQAVSLSGAQRTALDQRHLTLLTDNGPRAPASC